MITAVAGLTFRETHRRGFPFVAGAGFVLFAVVARFFLEDAFGGDARSARELVLSSVFLAGLCHALVVGCGIVRSDRDRGTLALLLTKPVGAWSYLLGRYLGLLAAGGILCAGVAAGVFLLFDLAPLRESSDLLNRGLLAAVGRALLMLAVLEAAAMAASAVLPRAAAPVTLFGVFLLGNLAPGGGWIPFPDWNLFGMHPSAHPSWWPVFFYAAAFASAFLSVAYLGLGSVRGGRS